jgi:hypothetical protein
LQFLEPCYVFYMYNSLRAESIEQEPSNHLEVIFPGRCDTVENLLTKLENVQKGSGSQTVLLQEYDLEFDDVLDSISEISSRAAEKNIDLILAADNRTTEGYVSWAKQKARLEEAGVDIETESSPRDTSVDSIGFFFHKDGKVYVFPKSWASHPLHKIPGTKIAVSICGEISHLKPEQIEGVEVVYNPSREADDPYMAYRMMGLANPDVTRDEIIKQMMSGAQAEFYKETLNDESWEKLKREEPHLYKEDTDNKEAREARFNKTVEELWAIARNPDRNSPYYGQTVIQTASEKRIPIIRADVSDVDGVLNPFNGLTLKLENTGVEKMIFSW